MQGRQRECKSWETKKQQPREKKMSELFHNSLKIKNNRILVTFG